MELVNTSRAAQSGAHRSPAYRVRDADMGYALLRYVTFFLDDLSDQGLELWRTDAGHWCWRWDDMEHRRGFAFLGEAILDAVATRYDQAFDGRLTRYLNME